MSWLTIIVITMTICSIHQSLLGLMVFGVLILSSDLPTLLLLKSIDSIPDLGPRDQKQWMHLLFTEVMRITPVFLIPVIRHAQATGVRGTLIVSQWISAPFWPLLFPNGIDPAAFILEWPKLPLSDTLVLPGYSGANLFVEYPYTPVLAVRFQC